MARGAEGAQGEGPDSVTRGTCGRRAVHQSRGGGGEGGPQPPAPRPPGPPPPAPPAPRPPARSASARSGVLEHAPVQPAARNARGGFRRGSVPTSARGASAPGKPQRGGLGRPAGAFGPGAGSPSDAAGLGRPRPRVTCAVRTPVPGQRSPWGAEVAAGARGAAAGSRGSRSSGALSEGRGVGAKCRRPRVPGSVHRRPRERAAGSPCPGLPRAVPAPPPCALAGVGSSAPTKPRVHFAQTLGRVTDINAHEITLVFAARPARSAVGPPPSLTPALLVGAPSARISTARPQGKLRERGRLCRAHGPAPSTRGTRGHGDTCSASSPSGEHLEARPTGGIPGDELAGGMLSPSFLRSLMCLLMLHIFILF